MGDATSHACLADSGLCKSGFSALRQSSYPGCTGLALLRMLPACHTSMSRQCPVRDESPLLGPAQGSLLESKRGRSSSFHIRANILTPSLSAPQAGLSLLPCLPLITQLHLLFPHIQGKYWFNSQFPPGPKPGELQSHLTCFYISGDTVLSHGGR